MIDWSIIGIGVVLCVVGAVFGYTGWEGYRQRPGYQRSLAVGVALVLAGIGAVVAGLTPVV